MPNTAKPAAVLGISAYYHDSAAALVVDGNIVACAQEERFSRIKGDSSLPRNAIDYVLTKGGITAEDLTSIAYYENPYSKLDRQLTVHTLGKLEALGSFLTTMKSSLSSKIWVERDLKRIGGKKTQLILGDHHLSHAASAYYPSGYKEAATLTIDGVGEWTTTSIGHGEGDKITLIEHIEFPHSLGLLYSAFTAYCGFSVNGGEYKLMGLAPYGEPKHRQTILDNLIAINEDGSYALNPAHFAYFAGKRTYNRSFEELFGKPTRKPNEPVEQHHANIAASIQAVLDQAVLGLARRAKDVTGSKRLVLAGGVALNIVAMGKLERSGIFSDIWIQPAAGDAGGALGAALWATHHVHQVPRATGTRDLMRGALLGPEPSETGKNSKDALDAYGLAYEELSDADMSRAVAQLIADGSIVGVAKGPMEYGPRALGSRSILADARDSGMQKRLNLTTKFREGFRPFAPIVLSSCAEQYFDTNGAQSPYMLKTYYVKPELRGHDTYAANANRSILERAQEVRSTLPAVTHVDYSARVQTVEDNQGFLAQVLREFHSATGTAVLVNTSLNVRGEPIVCSAEDAIECFVNTDIDAIVIDNYLIRKTEQPESALISKRGPATRED